MGDPNHAEEAKRVLSRIGTADDDPDRLARLLAEREAQDLAEREERRAAWREMRPAVRAERLERELRRMGVRLLDDDMRMLVEGTLETTAAMAGAMRLLKDPDRRFIVMLGPVGVGKTIASVWLGMKPAEQTIDHWLSWLDRSEEPLADLRRDVLHLPHCEWVSAPELRARWNPWRDDRASGIQPLHRDAPTLIVDDLGTERLSEHWLEALGQLVDHRQTVGRTVLSTNLPRGVIRQRYGDRVADRLNHSGGAVHLTGPSMRRNGAGL